MPDAQAVRELASRVSAFHITDKPMRAAQRKLETALAAGDADDRDYAEYLNAVKRYFTGFEREAHQHLRDVDRRLEHANQVHFNLTAERGVAVRRIEATRAVLEDLARVTSP